MSSVRFRIGERIANLRKSISPKMTQASLAEKVGVETTTIYRWEKGINFPEEKHFQLLAEAFSVSVSEILGEPKSKTSHSPTVESLLNAIQEIQKEYAAMKRRSNLSAEEHELLSLWSSAHKSDKEVIMNILEQYRKPFKAARDSS